MTVILALETSTQTCSVALLRERDAQSELFHRSIEGPNGHAQNIFPLIDELFQHAKVEKRDLSVIAFGQGPGAFTGLRLACGIAQGIGLALGLDLIPVGSLHAVACAVPQPRTGEIILAALDARMDEVYLAAYVADNSGDLLELCPPVLMPASGVEVFVKQRWAGWIVSLESKDLSFAGKASLIGEGWRLVQTQSLTDQIPQVFRLLNQTALPDACQVARLALQNWVRGGYRIPPEQAAPLYLRDKVAFTTLERQAGEGGNPRAVNLTYPDAVVDGQVKLVPMTSADLNEVFALECSVQSFPWTLKNFEDALHADYDAWVLRNEQGLKGFCIVMIAPDLAHILAIAVAREAQRKGYAAMMLAHASDAAKARGAEGLILEVRPSNTAARGFYAQAGFQQVGVRRDYYPAGRGQREDAVILKKTFECG